MIIRASARAARAKKWNRTGRRTSERLTLAGRTRGAMVRPVHGGCWWAIAALVVAPGRQWLDGVIFDITERRGLEEELRRSLAEGAAAQERLRLARDLHDAVGHALTVGAIQAGGARAVVGSDPAAAERALHEVENCLREALREMREMVSALHYDPDSPPDGYLRLDDLIASAGRAGLDARLIVTGDERPLPAAVQASLYRSVQECLTKLRQVRPPVPMSPSMSPTSLKGSL